MTSKKLQKNQIIKKSDLKFKKPGNGIATVNYKKIIGKKILKNLNKDHVLSWADFK